MDPFFLNLDQVQETQKRKKRLMQTTLTSFWPEIEKEKTEALTMKNGKPKDILEYVSLLPPELKLRILRHMSLDQLLELNSNISFLKSLIPSPQNVDFESWLTELVWIQKGFIFVPSTHKLFMDNEIIRENDFEDAYTVSDIKPGLNPGVYKIKVLDRGFDIVKSDHHFISSQCGPRSYFCPADQEEKQYKNVNDNAVEDEKNSKDKENEEESSVEYKKKAWTTTFISRGFSIKTKNRKDLIHCESENWHDPNVWNPRNACFLPCLREKIKDPVCFIVIHDRFWGEPKKIEWSNSQSISNTEQFGVIRARQDNKIVAYFISATNGFTSHDPKVNSFEKDNFSLVWYGYTRKWRMVHSAGLIVTGEDGAYEPCERIRSEKKFPDKQFYDYRKYKEYSEYDYESDLDYFY